MKKGVEKEIENNVTGIKADEALQKELDSISKKKSAIEKKIQKGKTHGYRNLSRQPSPIRNRLD